MTGGRIMIAGTNSGVGKTTVATGIMAALRKRGLRVQGFKVGPDFIDPGFHEAATGRPSRNVDGWMLSRDMNLNIFARAMADADVAVVEGVMGVFDGKDFQSLSGTTAEMASWLDTTNVLVLNGAAMAGSAAAIVHGFDTLVPEFHLSAVICNKVAGARHYDFLSNAITTRCQPSVLGYLPMDASFSIPERHLGLHVSQEVITCEWLSKLADWIESHLDLDRLLKLSSRRCTGVRPLQEVCLRPAKVRIGIAKDAAFCFYYHDNLEMLRDLGGELVEFSPIADRELPADLDGLYLGGGYPELHAEALSRNEAMRGAILKLAADGTPVYAECGGFMYLTEAIVNVAGQSWPMTGIFPTRARMQPKLAKLAYMEIESGDEIWLAPGIKARGHEFRYSVIDPMPDTVCRAYREPAQGYRKGSVLGSYIHLHFGSCPDFARRFIGDCARRRAENEK